MGEGGASRSPPRWERAQDADDVVEDSARPVLAFALLQLLDGGLHEPLKGIERVGAKLWRDRLPVA